MTKENTQNQPEQTEDLSGAEEMSEDQAKKIVGGVSGNVHYNPETNRNDGNTYSGDTQLNEGVPGEGAF